MVWRAYAVEFCQSALASGGYTDWIRIPFQPLASQMKLGAAAQATSRTFLALKCQVRVGPRPRGRVEGCPTSVFAMIGTVLSDRSACARRARSAVVRTSTAFKSVPVATT